ncbi:hypothetical protein K505DRAFT_377681 [Melanomma pulvis-pyrius CBS 109.77]|uniref:Uncharacterized protein n=1 Tax=Melanomma pulvis-pyrius CBS 109.77 TaxID=1314802 RepID=A0A6A6X1I7_9PLEO|nr:hypothetical protein K505DRAFT_377681 [Melanomma pulvis-pyrius CBS 109.77]
MCTLTCSPDPRRTPRPLPRLAWSIPVDIVELGASLEAYSNIEAIINTLRLCHRFRQGPLSTLPQELLEQVIDGIHNSEKQQIRRSWQDQHACFQGRCTMVRHFPPNDPKTETEWLGLQIDSQNDYDSDSMLDPTAYNANEKSDMLEDFLRNCPDLLMEMHADGFDKWLTQTCLCKPAKEGSFVHFNNMLKSYFGLEALILQEGMSDCMRSFLPDSEKLAEAQYYTVCYLVLSNEDDSKNTHLSKSQNLFAELEDDLSFRQVIDPSSWLLSDSQRLQFSKALRTLGLEPHYHLTEIESLVSPTIKDHALKAICACSRRDCHIKNIPKKKKRENLYYYLAEKNRELARQSWPQLMCLAASTIVTPNDLIHWN